MSKELSILEIHQKMEELFCTYYDFRRLATDFIKERNEKLSEKEIMFLFEEFKKSIIRARSKDV